MKQKRNYFKLSSICFAFFLAMMFAFSTSTTSEASTLGKVTNVTQAYGELDSDTNKYYIIVQYNYLSNASAYAVQISTDKLNWEFAENGSYSTKNYFTIGANTKLNAGSTYYVKVIPLYTTANNNLDYYDADVDSATVLQVVTAPAKLGNLVQTTATANSITAKWAAVPGATGYNVYVKSYTDSEYVYNGTTTSTSYAVKSYNNSSLLPDSAYYVAVSPIRKSSAGYTAEASASGYGFRTLPKNTAISATSSYWTMDSKKLTVKWESDFWADGYELQLFNAKGKKIKTATVNTSSYSAIRSYTFSNAPKNASCSVKIRAFIKTTSGAKAYSNWSKKTYFLSQSNMPAKKYDLSKGTLTLKWTKITGAKKYVIYAGTSATKMKKVATVSSKKTSYTLKKIGGSKISTSKTYYVKVVPQAKLGGKTVKGDHGYYWKIAKK